MKRFAFIFHPLQAKDVAKKFSFLERWPDGVIETLARVVPPFHAATVTGLESDRGKTEGWFIAVPLTSSQMVQLPLKFVMGRIIKACRMAEKLGADIVGLGAFTSVVGDAGVTVSNNVGIAVTTGNSYTVATALEGTREASRLMGHDLAEVPVAIIGATGAIGSACARILARETGDLTLVSRTTERLEELARRIVDETGLVPRISTDVQATLARAAVVVTVSGSATPLIESGDLRRGAVVCDVARPRDVSARVGQRRDDVLVIDGGVVEVPGSNVNLNFRLGLPPRQVLACMAETMMLAMDDRCENFTLGRDLTVQQIDDINDIAARQGFRLAGLRSFERAVTPEVINRIRQAAGIRVPA